MKGKAIETLIIVLSLSNLLFFPAWRRLLYSSQHLYTTKYSFAALDYLSLIGLVVVLAAAMFAFRWAEQRLFSTDLLSRYLFVILTAFAVFQVFLILARTQFWIVTWVSKNLLLIGFGAMVLGILFLVFARRKVIPLAKAIVLIFSPFVLITFGQSVWHAINIEERHHRDYDLVSTSDPAPGEKKIDGKVIWIIFDELDYKVGFEKRSDLISMPEFDRLEKESLVLTNALPPSSDTLVSIPSLITGRRIVSAVQSGRDSLKIRFASDPKNVIEFRDAPNIFSRVRGLGGSSAVVGWYHPYCRLFEETLAVCYWATGDVAGDTLNETFIKSAYSHVSAVRSALPRKVRGYLGEFNNYENRHRKLVDTGKKISVDKNINLSFIHLPFPHKPNRFNRRKNDFGGGTSYVDNLALTDIVLGEIRRELEEAGLWDNSTVIVSSDHHWRVSRHGYRMSAEDLRISDGIEDHRVPFIVKLANSSEGGRYQKSINTSGTAELILEILTGKVTTSDGLIQWLDSRTTSVKN